MFGLSLVYRVCSTQLVMCSTKLFGRACMLYQTVGSNTCALPNCWVEHHCSTNQFGRAQNQGEKLPACLLETVSVTFSTVPSPKSSRKKNIQSFCPKHISTNQSYAETKVLQYFSCVLSFVCDFCPLRNIPKLLLQST